MTFEEFELKVGSILSNYGFVYEEGMIWWAKTTRHLWVSDTKIPGKPEAVFEYSYDSEHRNIYITYNSILYHFSPSGQHSITGKDYRQNFKEDGLKKFKWDVFEKWAKGQQETVSMAQKLAKENEIEKKIKAASKDFK